MADGSLSFLPTSREVAKVASLRPATVLPLQREPAPAFEIDRRAGAVIWTLAGLRLREPDDFRQLANLFLTNGWPRNFNALNDAELALSVPPPEAA